MNIFVLHEDPKKAVEMHCDKHVPKMVVESGQMLSTAHRLLDGIETKVKSKSGRKMSYWKLTDWREDALYKPVHPKHPCTIWSTETTANYKWHYDFFCHLCDEYTYRYGKKHLTDKLLREPLSNYPLSIPEGDLTPFKLAMGSNPECMLDNPIDAYRAFYATKRHRFKMIWSKRPEPQWWQKTCEVY